MIIMKPMPNEDSKIILVVDDEPRMINFIRMNLELENYRVVSAENGIDAVRKTRELLPDAVLLDVMMPEMDGFETLKSIREESNVPVIMLTAKSEEDDKVKGLELGADDYITKPFSPRELVTRVKAVVRRAELPAQVEKAPIKVDDRLSLDFNRREVIVEGKAIKLRPTEWRLLYHLVQNAGLGRAARDAAVQGVGLGVSRRDAVSAPVYHLSAPEDRAGHGAPQYILTERGIGYRFFDFKKNSA